MDRTDEIRRVIDDLHDTFVAMAADGCAGFACEDRALRRLARWGSAAPARVPESGGLKTIREEMGNCMRCRLAAKRKNIVFGDGNPRARLVFVGEGPGYEEDQQGVPFVGAAGQLLTKIIEAIGLKREDVYICNIVKCRPPENRNPEPDEIQACLPFLRRQIEVIGPGHICALGGVAAQTLLKTDKSISRLRGRFYDFGGIRMMPTYHPAYLLRNAEKKRDVWEDMKMLMREMGDSSGDA